MRPSKSTPRTPRCASSTTHGTRCAFVIASGIAPRAVGTWCATANGRRPATGRTSAPGPCSTTCPWCCRACSGIRRRWPRLVPGITSGSCSPGTPNGSRSVAAYPSHAKAPCSRRSAGNCCRAWGICRWPTSTRPASTSACTCRCKPKPAWRMCAVCLPCSSWPASAPWPWTVYRPIPWRGCRLGSSTKPTSNPRARGCGIPRYRPCWPIGRRPLPRRIFT
ncbi:hypothetical protein D3C76_842890 [compost metagenome]